MALVTTEVAQITYTVKDDDGAESRIGFHVQLPTLNQWTQEAAERTISELWALVSALIDSALTGYTFLLTGYDDAFPAATGGSDVEDKGVFLSRTSNNKPTSVALASILESKLVTSGLEAGVQIDVEDTDVAAFITALEDGIDLSPWSIMDTVRFCTDRGENISVVVDAYKQNRASFRSRRSRG